jgi:hypothetical protein
MKICKTCKQQKSIDRFGEFVRPSGVYHYGTCKDCINAKRRKGTRKVLFNDREVKECGSCGAIKKHEHFAMRNGNPVSKCKDCHNKYYKMYYSDPEVRSKHRQRVRANKANWPTFRKHGLTEEKFNSIKTANGMCPICNIRRQEVIDHDHECCAGSYGCNNCVRGYICMQCNAALGMVNDSPDILNKLISYLRR